MYKDWKNMTPEQKQNEKLAIIVMGGVAIVIAVLFLLACCSHG